MINQRMKVAILDRMISMGEDARLRVNRKNGWASYSYQDYDKAFQMYEEDGLDLLLCEDLFDDGKSVLPPVASA